MDMEQAKGTGIKDKHYIWFIAGYLLLAFILPASRDFFDWQATDGASTIHHFFQLMFGIPLYFLLPMLLYDIYPNSKGARILDRIFSKNIILPIGILALCTFLLLTVIGVPGYWWTWLTVGIQICIVLLIVILLQKRLKPTEAFILGVGFMSISIGLWEIPYQIGLHLIHQVNYMAPEMVQQGIIREVTIEMAFIIGGAIIVYFYQYKYKLIRFTKPFWILSSLFVAGYTLWVTTGMWVEMIWDDINKVWLQQPIDYGAKVLYRSTKVMLALVPISLVGGLTIRGGVLMKAESVVRIVKSYAVIPVWLLCSIGTTAFLVFDWLLAKVVGKRAKAPKPYFKIRSIASVEE